MEKPKPTVEPTLNNKPLGATGKICLYVAVVVSCHMHTATHTEHTHTHSA